VSLTESLGQYLRREREARSVSLKELSRSSRINLPFLEALEKDNFHFISRREYILGFLKAYARHLGLDAEEVLKRYHIQSELTTRRETFEQLPLFPISEAGGQEIREPEKIPNRLPPSQDRKRSQRRILIQVAILLAAVVLTLHFRDLLKQSEEKEKLRRVEHNLSREASPKASPERGVGLHSQSPERLGGYPLGSEGRAEENPRETTSERRAPAKNENSKRQVEREPPSPTTSAKIHRKVIGNRARKSYYLPGMKDHDRVGSAYRIEFDTEEEAIQAGFHKARQ
jgi:cytoskeletal protein RodZ